MRFFARVDKIVGVLGYLGVYVLVEDMNLNIIEVLTDDYEFEQRTILYKDDITRAEKNAIVRHPYTIMSRCASTKVRNVGKALLANKPGRRIRRQQDGGKGVSGKSVSSDVAVAGNDNSNAKEGGRKYAGMRNKWHRCLDPGHRWFDCTAHVIPAANMSQKNSGKTVGCLAIGMLRRKNAVREREHGKDDAEKELLIVVRPFT